MPYYLLRCKAPRAHRHSELCDREFTAYSPHALYCSGSCINRAHRVSRKLRQRRLGYGATAHPSTSPEAYETRLKATISDPLVNMAAGASTSTTADIEKALTLSRLTEVDSEAELRALGYSSDKRAERWIQEGHTSEPRAAEPKLSTPRSDESNPPQFSNVEYEPNPDDPYADYQAPQAPQEDEL